MTYLKQEALTLNLPHQENKLLSSTIIIRPSLAVRKRSLSGDTVTDTFIILSSPDKYKKSTIRRGKLVWGRELIQAIRQGMEIVVKNTDGEVDDVIRHKLLIVLAFYPRFTVSDVWSEEIKFIASFISAEELYNMIFLGGANDYFKRQDVYEEAG